MDRWLKSPWFIRIISLILAVLLYASVALNDTASGTNSGSALFSQDTELASINDIPVNLYVDEEKYIVRGAPQAVTVTVEGPKSEVMKAIRQRSFSLFIDLRELETGSHTVPIKHSGFSNQLSVYMEPSEADITIEKRLTKKVSVEVDFMNRGRVASGYELGKPSVEPKQIEVTGSESEVSKVALVKAILDVQGISESIQDKEAPVKVYDEQGNELNVIAEPATVQVNVPVSYPSKEVSVAVKSEGNLPNGLTLKSLELTEDTVEIYGPSEAIDAIDSIKDIRVDLSNVKEDGSIKVDLPLPEKVEKVEPSQLEVQVDVEESGE
ncbi:hypothetical protein N781_06850 [Pontibacillus halophilus JSM 076056 = DSM 19796]|uniref:YbbR-like domain-containing protein ybbR n=1 Tax=Pontibacillus halophilus JSM 076056 = DSM 19796 TaxID=1385510 RepID=A0A0A5GEX6_9BACI|nr:CdaR family protein [Pontibacillus halophilus]KGX90509.1 hypothetical protein N781_06850 [Pontibacillus halophilus JSM 076056 = DSM 19796]